MSMLKKLMTVAAMGVATFVLAQGVVVESSYGTGVAANEQGGAGRFNYEVMKRSPATGNPIFNGRFRFERISTNAAQRFVIEMGKPRVLAVAENVCEFGGPAVLLRRNANGQNIRVEGRLEVRVVDRRRPNQPNPSNLKDVMSWRFVRPNSNEVLTFEGLVREGDLVVKKMMGS
jgi:hypothetical protein